MTDHQENLVSNLKEDLNNQLKSSIVDAMMIFQQFDPPPPSLAETSASSESANFVTSTLIMETLLSHVKDLQKELSVLKAIPQHTPHPSPPVTNPDINPKTGKLWKRYCWTCGCCPHLGRSCPFKAPGHKDKVTFKNRMGSSNKNCLGSG